MAVESSKMTRNQVHQKLKENFQALCTRCPQLADRKDSLDDSLTNLQWLWNLNVNIANPVDGGSRNGGCSRNGSQELYRSGSSTIFVPNRRQEHRPHRSVGGRSRQSKSSASYSKANSNFRSTAPVSSSSGQHKYITTVNVDPSMGVRASPSSKGGQKYRKQVDIVKASPQKSDEEKANIFFTNPHTTTSLDEFEFEEKPDISKLNFHSSSKNYSYPLLSDAAFYPSVSTSDHNSCKIITPSSVTVLNHGDLELKPLYSLPTLITLALQNAPNSRMCLSSICQWIRDNCDFYRTSNDNSWQKSVEKTLKQNESFVKVPKKKSHTRKTQWEIAENLNQSTEDFFGGLPFAKIRGLSALSFQSPASRGLFGNGSAATTAMNLFNRKRKQPMPQKIVRLRNQQKRRRQNNGNNSDLSTLLDQLDESNPLHDQAPEVGSLKGDFNWTTIFDEFTSDNLMSEPHIPHSRASSSPLVSPNPLSDSASSFFNLAFGSLAPTTRFQSNRSQAASESSDSSSQVGANNENLNLFAQSDDFGASSSSYDVDSSPTQDEMDKLLNGDSLFQSISDMNNDDVIIDGLDGNVGSISIDEFFQGAAGLDLTVQGHQISAPPHWAPVGTDLETILCESQDSNLSASNSSSGASR